MRDELAPAVAIARDRTCHLEVHRGIRLVQARDQVVPDGIDPQILWLVDDPRSIHEADDLDRMAAIVRIGDMTLDLRYWAAGVGTENVSADRREIGVEARHKFARRVDPLPRRHSNQSQEY